MSPAVTLTRRIVQLLVGLFLYGIGISLMVQAGIGVAPWDVLTQGLSHQTGLDFGLLTNVIGGVVLLCWVPIRQRPGFGTLANVLLIGPSAQFGLWLLPKQSALGYQLLFLAGGILL
ncbi:MAG TPA: membrane protein, partial [Galbitalea sp.]|nr:membrane protein [Galbitalea sp.]